MSEKPVVLIVERKKGCDCDQIDTFDGYRLGYWKFGPVGGAFITCPHGSTVRAATLADVLTEDQKALVCRAAEWLDKWVCYQYGTETDEDSALDDRDALRALAGKGATDE